jgi:hypothetical protein
MSEMVARRCHYKMEVAIALFRITFGNHCLECRCGLLKSNASLSRVSFKISLRREVSNRQDEAREVFVEALELIETELAALPES